MSNITLRDISENESVIGDMSRNLLAYMLEQQKLASVTEREFGAGQTSARLEELGQLFKETAEDIRLLMQNYIEITGAIVRNFDEIDQKLGNTNSITQTNL